MSVTLQIEPGDHRAAIEARLSAWSKDQFGARLWARDPTLWFTEPQPELENRLGWLGLPSGMASVMSGLEPFRTELRARGISRIVVLGMGGSSLAPEVYQAILGNRPGHPELLILDSTHPETVRSIEQSISPAETLFIVSSKSGTTLEMLSFFRYFWKLVGGATADPGQHFAAVTDPGSPLEELARERGFSRVFGSPPDVGGRYSALSEFGLVPAASIGIDLDHLRLGALDAAGRCGAAVDPRDNPALVLGALLGELAVAGKNKATFLTSRHLRPLLPWIEQLVAESTGKEGRGIVPLAGDEDAIALSNDRLFVLIEEPKDPLTETAGRLLADGRPLARLTLEDVTELGGAMFVFEMAVAAAGAILGINPFNQSNVQMAKDLARRAMAGDLDMTDISQTDARDPDLSTKAGKWLKGASPPGYVGIHAYLPATEATRAALETMRVAVRDGRGVATTFDFGPRLLHSTGQLHKGGPAGGRFLQVIDQPELQLSVPETDFTFNSLIRAQALGDHKALRDRGQSVLLVNLGSTGGNGLATLVAAIATASKRK